MQIIGIEKDKNSLYSALVRKKNGKITIQKLQSHSAYPGAKKNNVKPIYIYRKDGDSPKNPMASGLNTRDVLIQNFALKIRKKSALKKAISLQAEVKSSLDPDHSISLPLIHKETELGSPVSLFTTSKDRIESHLNSLSKVQLDPEFISCEQMALVRFAKSLTKKHAEMWLLHLGQGSCSCVMMEDNFPRKSHSIPLGVSDLMESIFTDKDHFQSKKDAISFAKKIDLLKVDEEIYPKFFQLAQELKNHISKAFFSFSKDGKRLPLLITGQRENFHNFSPFLLEGFEELVSESIEKANKEEEIPQIRKYAIPIGLALDALSQDSYSLQFRQQEFIPKKQIRKLKFQFIGFFLLCFLMITSMAFSAHQYIDEKEERTQSHFKRIQKLDHRFLNIRDSKLENEIDIWKYYLRKEAKQFPYYFKATKVHNALMWLTQLHSFNTDEIEWKEFRYQLKQYPKINSTKESYLVWVEVEFSCNNPSAARIFHEELLKDPYLQQKQEVKWDVLDENLYRVSFYLNNQA